MNHTIKLAVASALLSTSSLISTTTYAEGTFSITSGVDYSTGKYGQAESTDITYVPFIGKYEANNTTLKLTVPWVKITGPGDVVGGSSPIVVGSSNRPTTTESGLGDVVFSATQSIAQIGEKNPLLLDITGKVKFATASTSKGLGTGKNDYTVELDAYKQIIKPVTVFADIGYKKLGDPSGLNLNNVWFGSAGVAFKLSQETSTGFMADIRQATLDSSQPLRELTLFLTHKLNATYKLQSYITSGNSDASTDLGGGIMLGITFQSVTQLAILSGSLPQHSKNFVFRSSTR